MKLSRSSVKSVLTLASMLVAMGSGRSAWAAEDESESGAKDDSEAKGASAENAGDDDEKKDDEKKDDEKKDDEKKDDEKKDEAFGHHDQLGLRVGVVGGYRMILRYDDSPYCRTPDPLKAANNQPKFCGHGAPFAITTALSFALFDFLEPFAWGRFGLGPEEQTDTEPVLMFGAGVRLYTMSDAPFKIFIEPAAGIELEGGSGTAAWQANHPKYKNDLVLHLSAGPTLDFSRYVGAYLTAGITASIFRALASSLDVELGVQGRLP